MNKTLSEETIKNLIQYRNEFLNRLQSAEEQYTKGISTISEKIEAEHFAHTNFGTLCVDELFLDLSIVK